MKQEKRRVLFSRDEMVFIDQLVTDHKPASIEHKILMNSIRRKLLSNIINCDGLSMDSYSQSTGQVKYAAIEVPAVEVKKFEDSRLDQLQRKVEAGEEISAEEEAEMMKLMGFGV